LNGAAVFSCGATYRIAKPSPKCFNDVGVFEAQAREYCLPKMKARSHPLLEVRRRCTLWGLSRRVFGIENAEAAPRLSMPLAPSTGT
jgi:hypothetical protein